MYYLQSAYGVLFSIQSQWITPDHESVLNAKLSDLFTDYRKLYLQLGNDFLNEPIWFDLDTIRSTHIASQLTVGNWLIQNGTNTLEPIDFVPNFQTRYVYYSDAFRAGYKVDLAKLGVGEGTVLPRSEYTSLRLKKPDVDMELFERSCIVSVNGFWHNIVRLNDSIIVVDGAKSMHKSRQNQLGIYSFHELGEIRRVLITEDMIYGDGILDNYCDKLYIDIGEDITDEVAILVMGGYLVLPDRRAFYQTGDQTFALNLQLLPYMDRYFESEPYLDLSHLGLSHTTQNPTQIDVQELYSNEVIKKYLTLSQSFIIFLKADGFFTNRLHIRKSKLPGMFTSYVEPKYPLIVANGRVAEYWKTKEGDHWAVNVYDSYLHNRIFDTVVSKRLLSTGDQNIPVETYKDSRGYLLEIGVDSSHSIPPFVPPVNP